MSNWYFFFHLVFYLYLVMLTPSSFMWYARQLRRTIDFSVLSKCKFHGRFEMIWEALFFSYCRSVWHCNRLYSCTELLYLVRYKYPPRKMLKMEMFVYSLRRRTQFGFMYPIIGICYTLLVQGELFLNLQEINSLNLVGQDKEVI